MFVSLGQPSLKCLDKPVECNTLKGCKIMESFQQLTNLIQQNCPEIVKNFWEPVKAEESESSRSNYVTKFGGSNPFRGNNFRWPMCQDCESPKTFICQIEVAKIPDENIHNLLKNFGLLQCFWCMPYGCVHDNWEDENPFRLILKSEMIPSLQILSAIAVYESKGDTSVLPSELKKLKKLVKNVNEQFEDFNGENLDSYVGKEVQVKSWIESDIKEIPMPEEISWNNKISETVLKVPGMTQDILNEVTFMQQFDDAASACVEARPIATPQFGVKIGGYVRWFEDHGYEGYSTCDDCHVKMDVHFLQLSYHEDLQEYEWVLTLYQDIPVRGRANVLLCPDCGKPKISIRDDNSL